MQKLFPEFSAAVRQGKEDASDRVERALFERACGYSHPAVKILVVDKGVQKVDYIQHYPPDTAAASLWLRNMRPVYWKERQTLEHSGPGGTPIQVITGVPDKPLTVDDL